MYNKYPDEDAFREQFVKPLLNRVGFLRVAERHGPWELGKDFVFSEIDRFGLMRHYCAQVKHEESIGIGVKLDGLWSQVQQSFANAFTLPDSPRECFVSAVYIINSGKITEQAKTDLHGRMRGSNYSDSIYFLDGERLETLNKWGSLRRDEDIRQRLVGIKNQLQLNMAIWGSIQNLANTSNMEPLPTILHGIEEFLSRPFLTEKLPYEQVVYLWKMAASIECFRKSAYAAMEIGTIRENARMLLAQCIPLAISNADQFSVRIDEVLTNLKPL